MRHPDPPSYDSSVVVVLQGERPDPNDKNVTVHVGQTVQTMNIWQAAKPRLTDPRLNPICKGPLEVASLDSFPPVVREVLYDGRNRIVLLIDTNGLTAACDAAVCSAVKHVRSKDGSAVLFVSSHARGNAASLLAATDNASDRKVLETSRVQFRTTATRVPADPHSDEEFENFSHFLLDACSNDQKRKVMAAKLHRVGLDTAPRHTNRNPYRKVRFTGTELGRFGIVKTSETIEWLGKAFEKEVGMSLKEFDTISPVRYFFGEGPYADHSRRNMRREVKREELLRSKPLPELFASWGLTKRTWGTMLLIQEAPSLTIEQRAAKVVMHMHERLRNELLRILPLPNNPRETLQGNERNAFLFASLFANDFHDYQTGNIRDTL